MTDLIRNRRKREKSTFDYVFAAIFQLAVVLALNAYALWRPFTLGVVTDAFPLVLWAVNLAGTVQVAGNLTLAFLRPEPLLRLMDVCFAVVGLISVSVFLTVFPVDFGAIGLAWVNLVARGVLLLATFGVGVATAVYLVRFLAGSGPRESPQP